MHAKPLGEPTEREVRSVFKSNSSPGSSPGLAVSFQPQQSLLIHLLPQLSFQITQNPFGSAELSASHVL